MLLSVMLFICIAYDNRQKCCS